jgi:phosphate transport system substrate-binding protein
MNTNPKRQCGNLAAWPVAAWLALVGATVGCQPAGLGTRNLVLTGSDIMAPLIGEIGRRFEARHPGVRVDVQGVGSERGASDTRTGLADVGMIARPLRPEETRLHAFLIARDGLAFIVHRSNPVPSLTPEQVARIYTRAVTNWKEVGGSDIPITLVQQGPDSAALQLFLVYFKFQPTPLPSDVVVGDDGAGIQALAHRPGAIAYAAVSRAVSAAESPVRLLPCAGVTATRENIRDGLYPLSVPLTLVTRDPPRGLARDFIDFARSDEVRDAIATYHLVPPAPEGPAPPTATSGTPTPDARGCATTSAAPGNSSA